MNHSWTYARPYIYTGVLLAPQFNNPDEKWVLWEQWWNDGGVYGSGHMKSDYINLTKILQKCLSLFLLFFMKANKQQN